MMKKTLLATFAIAFATTSYAKTWPTFNEVVTTCARYINSKHPGFDAFVLSGTTTVQYLGTTRAHFEFDKCMNAYSYPLTDVREP